MRSIAFRNGDMQADAASPSWILVYATVDQRYGDAVQTIARRYPNVPIFGATSFQGVMHEGGFSRGVFALAGESGDGVRAAHVIKRAAGRKARNDAKAAALEIIERLGTRPDALLLHATPGFEERLLEGVTDAFDGKAPPLYGGSAADDDLSGNWRIFTESAVEEEGFLLVGFSSKKPVHGSFVAGYNPGTKRGKVTAAHDRVIRSIDGRPAARVYNEWLDGALDDVLEIGGNVLSRTSLHPLGHVVDRVGAVPRYLLSHPHAIGRDGSLSLFTDVHVGDEIVLMVGSADALVDRTDQVAARAARGAGPLRGGILVYCAGCVGTIGERATDVAQRFHDRIGRVPFLGIATFGEQGCYVGTPSQNRHGNLMCDAILFE
ncbi:MAG: hypothetical protein HOW73_18985 [Polyangiaceae bacterium]|nr:hypothetical protein [Polyangiaceae bacterium]